ncbi:MAG: TIGR04219 family outer membrane beta-barrel protein [Epsilonproteobacteria bacterium]|nr:TIGR04219 family outer membrane beta-barrel protein [Campylobacterota bacterium]
MKKILTTIAFATLLGSSLSADMARLEMGVGAWQQTPSGTISYSEYGFNGTDNSKEIEENEAYMWMLIKHPIPVIPNLRLEYSHEKNYGTATGAFKDFSIAQGATSNTTLDVTEFDVIPYYNILDNTAWVTLDLGIDFKIMQTEYEADNVNIAGSSVNTPLIYSDDATVVVPLAYLRGRVEIPFTGLGVESDIKYITYSGSTLYDIRAKVDYTFDTGLPLDVGFEIGYRIKSLDIDDDDSSGGAKTDLEFKGVYAGIMFRY